MVRRIHLHSVSPGEIRLDDAQAHHARDVLRLETGAIVELFDDAGSIARGEIVSVDPHVVVRADSITSSQLSGPHIIVASAVPKGDRADWMVEKLSELGVEAFVPLQTERSVVHPRGAGKRDRWQRIAVESAKQSRRSGVMRIEELTELSSAIDNARGCFLSTAADAQPLAQIISNLKSQISLHLFIGPEGGWTDGEIALLTSKNLTPAKLTATILRVETAAIAAAAIVAANFVGNSS